MGVGADRSPQEVQGEHLSGPGSMLVLGRLVTGVVSQSRGGQPVLPPACPTRVGISEGFVVCGFQGRGASLFAGAAGPAWASRAGPLRLVGGCPQAPALSGPYHCREPRFRACGVSHHVLGASESLTRAGHQLHFSDKFVHSLTVCLLGKQTPVPAVLTKPHTSFAY